MLKIWGRTNSVNVQKVMWTVGELGLDHERVDAGGAFGGLDTPEYGRLNPNRKVPTIQDGELVMWESNACVRYLAARYGQGSFWPEDPARRAHADMWMDWTATTLMPDMTIVFWQLVRTAPDKRDMPGVEAAARRLGPIWLMLDQWLGDRPFVAGSEPTVGDIPAGALFYRYMNLPIDRPGLPNLQIWYQDLKGRDAYRRHVMLPLT
jgi:glutathione S-transferase